MSIAITQNIPEIPKPISLLRRNKYYIKATNGECANCKHGQQGCCQPGLRFTKEDFRMDFTSLEEVRALFELGVFHLSVNYESFRKMNTTYVTIRIKGAHNGRIRNMCIFWTEKGCRLTHNVRPDVCRKHTCWELDIHPDSVKEVNKRNKKPRWGISHWSEDEIITILQVASECDFGEYTMPTKEYRKLDWDSILTVLQGRP